MHGIKHTNQNYFIIKVNNEGEEVNCLKWRITDK